MYQLSECHAFPVENGICARCRRPCESYEVTAERYGFHDSGGMFIKHELPTELSSRGKLSAKELIVAELVVSAENGLSCLYYEDDDPKEKIIHLDAEDLYQFTISSFWQARNTRHLTDTERDEIYYADERINENRQIYKEFLASLTKENITNSILPAILKNQFQNTLFKTH